MNLGCFKFSLHQLALGSLSVYVILAGIFEESQIGLSWYASLGAYLFLLLGGFYIIVNKAIKYNLILISLFVFGIDLTLSYLYSPTSTIIKSMYLYRYWTSFILIVIAYNVIETDNDIKMLLHTYIMAGMFMAIYMYFHYGFSNLMVIGDRVGQELGNQNSIGILCASSIILSIIYLMERNDFYKWGYLLPIIISLPACLFTGSRKSVLLMGICISVYTVLFKKDTKRLLYMILLPTILGAIWFSFGGSDVFSGISDRFASLFSLFMDNSAVLDTGSQNRLLYISDGWNVFLDNPIIGNGFCYSYYRWGVYSHNNFIELLMNNGIIGFSIYYFCHYIIYRKLMYNNTYKLSMNNMIALILLIILLFLDIGSVNYYVRHSLILLILCSIITK